jgi:hypothetical protein
MIEISNIAASSFFRNLSDVEAVYTKNAPQNMMKSEKSWGVRRCILYNLAPA